ncbi:hypothetical protein ACS0TY_022944 [Phlomoides rotata]
MWVEDDKCQDIVEFGWDPRNTSHTFQDRTKACGLLDCGREKFGSIQERIKKAEERLNALYLKPQEAEVIQEEKDTKLLLESLLK